MEAPGRGLIPNSSPLGHARGRDPRGASTSNGTCMTCTTCIICIWTCKAKQKRQETCNHLIKHAGRCNRQARKSTREVAEKFPNSSQTQWKIAERLCHPGNCRAISDTDSTAEISPSLLPVSHRDARHTCKLAAAVELGGR